MGLLRGREISSLLMHVSIPGTLFSLGFLYFSFSFLLLYFLCFLIFLSISFFFFFVYRCSSFFLCPPFSLFMTMAFYTACHDRIYHFYPSTAFGSLWASFQDYLLTCRLPSHYHYTVLAAPRLIPKQKWFCSVSYLS